ncbi:MAG TPA: hypothetical protein VK327_02075 [Candidatus Paceibacterota bacterium]|nr:hypothetical protein [Candidatus Paceibacterota bacterium]
MNLMEDESTNSRHATAANNMHLRFLRLFLGFSAFVWGVSVFGVFLSWPAASQALEGLGAQPIAYDPMLDYWLRMASGAFTLVGCWYLVLMIWPGKFHAAIPWFGWLMLAEGLILLVSGLRLSLPPFPFYGDTAACFLGGGGILFLSPHAKTGDGKDGGAI